MLVQRTIQIGLPDDPDIRTTIRTATEVQRILSPICFNRGKPLSQLALHRKAYRKVRGRLNSQMTLSCIRMVASAYVSAKSNRRPAKRAFKFTKPRALFLIGDRGRDASLRDGLLSIWTTAGRKRIAYTIPDYFKLLFYTATELDSLTLLERDGGLVGKLTLSVEVPEPSGASPIGIDLNATNALVAVDSADRVLFISGKETRLLNARTRKTRSRIQRKFASRKAEKKDTRSVRRLLKRLGHKQRNRTRTFCQTTAKRLVDWAPPNAVLVFEQLKIRQVSKISRLRKGTRRKLSQWPRRLMRSCVENKAEERGIPVVDRNPAYTSQDCSRCGEPGERWGHRFRCPSCQHHEHADINAGRNIRDKFTAPRSRGRSSTRPETRLSGKPRALARGR